MHYCCFITVTLHSLESQMLQVGFYKLPTKKTIAPNLRGYLLPIINECSITQGQEFLHLFLFSLSL